MGPMKLPRPTVVAIVCVLLAACSAEPSPSPSASVPATPEASTAAPTASPSPSMTAEPTPSPSPTVPPIAADPPPLGLEVVARGIADPIGISAVPDGTLLVNERAGRVVALDPATGETAVALDIGDRVLADNEQGLLGLALHPRWPDVPRAFVHYTDLAGDTVLSEFAAASGSEGPPLLDAASERILLRQDQPHPNHNGGQLSFGPDGYLYLALGDGGPGGDPGGNGQDTHTLLGKILRLDVDGDAGQPYAIPPDNPFADGDLGAPEVYFSGLRNPWRFSFDEVTGEIWIADVGQNQYEEINRIDPAAGARGELRLGGDGGVPLL